MARQPFYGRGPGPQIARMDMQAATAPGRAYGQMYANLGKIAGDSIEKFAEGKKKKEEQKQTASFIKRALINSPETAAQFGITGNDSVTFEEAVDQGSKAIAKDPKGFEIVKGFAAMADQRNKARQDAESFALREREFGLKEQAQGRLFKNEDEQRELQRGLARFQTTERDLPITPELMADPDFVPPPLDPDPFVAPPRTYKEQAPGVERLPESFQPQGQRVIDDINKGTLTPMQGNFLLGEIEARAIAEAPEMMSLKDRLDLETKLEERERKLQEDIRSKVEDERKDEEYKGEQKIKSFDGLKFEGLELQGSIQDATEAKKAKEGLLNFNAVMRDLDRLKELGRLREEKTILKDDLKKEAAIISNRVRGQIRESILGPGTVNDSERKILVEQVPDPTEDFDLFSATYGEEGVALIEKLQNNLRKKVVNNFANYGVTFKQSAGQASGRPTNSPPSESIRLGSGDEVEVFRLDR